MIDKDTKINITSSFKFNDKDYILNMQKVLLLSLQEKNKLSANQYDSAVKLLEKKSRKH